MKTLSIKYYVISAICCVRFSHKIIQIPGCLEIHISIYLFYCKLCFTSHFLSFSSLEKKCYFTNFQKISAYFIILIFFFIKKSLKIMQQLEILAVEIMSLFLPVSVSLHSSLSTSTLRHVSSLVSHFFFSCSIVNNHFFAHL